MESDLQNVKADVTEIKSDLKAIKKTLDQAQGGLRMLWFVAGIAGAVGAVLSKLLFAFIR